MQALQALTFRYELNLKLHKGKSFDEIFEDDEPKYLNKAVLKYPETLIVSLVKESKYLYKEAIFEIVAHAMNIHREDIKSDTKIKKIIKESQKDLQTDVRELYSSKVKIIYGEIIRYATTGQSTLGLSEAQSKRITEIKIANRKMVQTLKETKELSRNVSKYLNSDNKHIKNEYDRFRKKVARVLRIIYLFRTEEDNETYYLKLQGLKKEAKNNILKGNKQIDKLIRENLIDVEMASSLVNDNDNVNNMIEKLIQVAELLYGKMDSILDNDES